MADEPETVKTPVPQIDEITYKGTNSTPTISPEVEAEALALYNKLASEIVLRQEFYYTVVEDEEEFYDLTTTEVREVGNYQIVGTLSPATRVSGTFSNPALSLTVMDYNERTFTSTLVFSCLYKPSISRSQGTNTCSYHDFSE